MILRRLLFFSGGVLIIFLAMYSWNQRTQILDNVATEVGLELTGALLMPVRSLQNAGEDIWNRYFDLVDVRQDNERLQKKVEELEALLLASGEERAELKRLRALLKLPVDASWRPLGARVLSGRIGPNAVLDSITINRGYTTGGRPGTPLVTHMGLVGRVLKASAHSSIALLLTDPGSRIAVFSQNGRASGILTGMGAMRELEVNFMQRDVTLRPGEILITSGLDGKYPKGIPAARVISAAPSDYTQFLAVRAEPLVDLRHLEEVLLLEPTGLPASQPDDAPPAEIVGPPAPRRAQP